MQAIGYTIKVVNRFDDDEKPQDGLVDVEVKRHHLLSDDCMVTTKEKEFDVIPYNEIEKILQDDVIDEVFEGLGTDSQKDDEKK